MTDIATSTVLCPVPRNERCPRRKYDNIQKEFNLIRFVVISYRQRDADEPNNNVLVFGVYEVQVTLVLA